MEHINEEKLKAELAGFTGTESYYRHFSGLLYTEGVKFLADKAGCHWLIDIVASYQYKLKNIGFQLWTLKVMPDRTAEVTAKEDTNTPILVSQKIEYTDFPLSEIKLYYIDGVLILLSEY